MTESTNFSAGTVVTSDWLNEVDRHVFEEFVTVAQFGAVGDGITDDTAAIQAAIDAAYEQGGGEVRLLAKKYLVSGTITIPQRVILAGPVSSFANQYASTYAKPMGASLFLADGSNCDVVLIRCRLTNNGGVLEETTIGGRNVDARHSGGLRNVTIWGNRSASADPATRDLQTSGDGVSVQGSRYVVMENVIVMYCYEAGIRVASYNYGTGSTPCNNLMWRNVSSLSNGGDGYTMLMGDSSFTQMQAGYNGGNGFSVSLGGSIMTGCFSWNNYGSGFVFEGGTTLGNSNAVSCRAYDNCDNGFRLSACQAIALSGCLAVDNGRTDVGTGGTAADAERSNFHVSSSANNPVLSGCISTITASVNMTHYGFRIQNVVYDVVMDACNHLGTALTEDLYVYDETKLVVHSPFAAATQPRHPGFVAQGNILMNAKNIQDLKLLTMSTWDSVPSITANVLPVTGSFLNMNCTGAQTVNDITFAGTGLPFMIVRNSSADPVTFTHDTTKIRCANATNVVLSQYEAAMFCQVSSTIWQQIGLA